jgi:hypothetical protein
MNYKILFTGDSHAVHCFSNGISDVLYLRDITFNKIRKLNSSLTLKDMGFDDKDKCHVYDISENGEDFIDMVNNIDYDYILLSIGEIDIRFHNSKLIDQNIFINTLDHYKKFLLKINKKLIIMSILPPSDRHNSAIPDRIKLTKAINYELNKFCQDNNFIFFDINSDFNLNDKLNISMSDGGVHVNKIYQTNIIEKLNKVLYENSLL